MLLSLPLTATYFSLLVYFLGACLLVSSDRVTHETTLRKKLNIFSPQKGFRPTPVREASNPIQLNITLNLLQILKVVSEHNTA